MSRHERSAGIILFRNTPEGPAFLLLDYGSHWDYPKGHLEDGEDDLSAARREVLEETGISQYEIDDAFREEVEYYFRSRKHGVVRKTVTFFLARTDAGPADVSLSHEHVGFEFLPFELARERLTYATARRLLERAHERLGGQARNQSPA